MFRRQLRVREPDIKRAIDRALDGLIERMSASSLELGDGFEIEGKARLDKWETRFALKELCSVPSTYVFVKVKIVRCHEAEGRIHKFGRHSDVCVEIGREEGNLKCRVLDIEARRIRRSTNRLKQRWLERRKTIERQRMDRRLVRGGDYFEP